MKNILIIIGVLVMLVATIGLQRGRIKALKSEVSRGQSNAASLLKETSRYKTESGAYAAEAYSLSLKVKELERFRAGDLETIKELNLKKRRLESVVTSQIVYRDTIHTTLRDSIIIVKSAIDTIRCLKHSTPYFTLDGCIVAGVFAGSYQMRDSILIVESVKYRRFLGFLWPTKKVIDRKIDVTSRNPAMEIQDLEFIKIVN